MKKDKFKIYILELLLIVILFFALFAPSIFTRSVLAVIMFVYMIITSLFLKKRKINSIYKKQVTILMIVFAGIYLVLFYLMGLYFGFEKSKIVLSIWSIFRFIIPLSIIIFSSEIIRKVFLAQENVIHIKSWIINLSQILTYIAMVLVDLVIYTGIYDLTNLDDFLMALGFVLFASLSCNLLYNYISIRYNAKGIIIYRLITILYVYIIPIVPDVYIFFKSFLRMLYPYLIYIVLEKLYSKNDFTISYIDKRKEIFGNTFLLIAMTLLIMLISCQFRYGILVIGSRSMTGTINKGDAVISEKYDNQKIKKGQVIIFNYNGVQTVHRVVEIKNVNGVYRYYTKGDANKNMDDGYITENEIYALVKLKIKYIGYPTLWIRELFS
ncbi:MAG: signal peptidase I [bacterium]|nr:signal peptidase I [bacterium]